MIKAWKVRYLPVFQTTSQPSFPSFLKLKCWFLGTTFLRFSSITCKEICKNGFDSTNVLIEVSCQPLWYLLWIWNFPIIFGLKKIGSLCLNYGWMLKKLKIKFYFYDFLSDVVLKCLEFYFTWIIHENHTNFWQNWNGWYFLECWQYFWLKKFHDLLIWKSELLFLGLICCLFHLL